VITNWIRSRSLSEIGFVFTSMIGFVFTSMIIVLGIVTVQQSRYFPCLHVVVNWIHSTSPLFLDLFSSDHFARDCSGTNNFTVSSWIP
jgi:hypothetical protein